MKTRASPRFIMIASLVLLAFAGFSATAASAAVSSTDASLVPISSVDDFSVQSTTSIDSAEVTCDEKISTTTAPDSVIWKEDFVATTTSWTVPVGPPSSTLAPAPSAMPSPDMTGTPVDIGRVSRGVGEMQGVAAFRTQPG